jgi:hypothetical protein
MVKIYTDTNILRYFGEAFAIRYVPPQVAMQLLLAPLAMLELLSQLGTDDAEAAFTAVRALPRVHNPAGTGVLPWTDNFFGISLFRLPLGEDLSISAVNNAVNRVLSADTAAELRIEGEEMRALLDAGKHQAADNFVALRISMQAEGKLDAAEDRRIFAQSIARRAGIDPASVDVVSVLTHLDAHYRFEQQRIQAAYDIPNYNIQKRANDAYDAELLIYLADPSLHLLTCDRGFERVGNSPQANRIHIVTPDDVLDPDRAIATLQTIVNSAAPTP